MNRCIVNIACGERYIPLGGRLAQSIRAAGDTSPLKQWVNVFPSAAPTGLQLPWAAYCAKPFALLEAAKCHDLILWMDAACYVAKPLDKLWEHIDAEGYYLQDNGFPIGEWISDAALSNLGLSRDEAMEMPESSSMVVGLDMRRQECRELLSDWARFAADGSSFMGAHTNSAGIENAQSRGLAYRGVGYVSSDPRCLGARHDQSVLSVLAHRNKWTRTPRPIFADYYKEPLDERTLIVNRG